MAAQAKVRADYEATFDSALFCSNPCVSCAKNVTKTTVVTAFCKFSTAKVPGGGKVKCWECKKNHRDCFQVRGLDWCYGTIVAGLIGAKVCR